MKRFWVFFLWAFILRALCAYFVYGPQALDDYAHGLIPVLNWFHHGVLDLPDYRNPLLSYVLRAWLEVGRWLSIQALVDQIRWLGWGLSLLQIFGFYAIWKIFAKESVRSQNLALFLYSSFIIMPFVATRAFGEAVALPFVLLGFMFLLSTVTLRSVFFGFFFIGIATLFRFQVGVLGVTALLWMLFQQRSMKVLIGATLAGVVILVFQGLIDLSYDRAFLATLFNYFRVNEGGAAQYGVSPSYNTWLFPMMVFLFPISWPLFNKESCRLIWQKWSLPLVSVFVFILIHSLIPHKEERFLYPILGVLLMFMALLWSKNWNHWWVTKFLTPMLYALHGVGVFAVVLSNSQEGVVKPLAQAEKAFHKFVVLETKALLQESELRSMFLVRGSEELNVSVDEVDQRSLEKIFLEKDFTGALWITSEPEVAARYKFMQNTEEKLYHCGAVEEASSLIDGVIYRLNPKHNQRRRPSWYLLCWKNQEKS